MSCTAFHSEKHLFIAFHFVHIADVKELSVVNVIHNHIRQACHCITTCVFARNVSFDHMYVKTRPELIETAI